MTQGEGAASFVKGVGASGLRVAASLPLRNAAWVGGAGPSHVQTLFPPSLPAGRGFVTQAAQET